MRKTLKYLVNSRSSKPEDKTFFLVRNNLLSRTLATEEEFVRLLCLDPENQKHREYFEKHIPYLTKKEMSSKGVLIYLYYTSINLREVFPDLSNYITELPNPKRTTKSKKGVYTTRRGAFYTNSIYNQ